MAIGARGASEVEWPTGVGGPWSRIARQPLLEFLAPRLVADDERPAVIFDDGFVLGHGVLRDRIERFAARLGRTVEAGDRVALALPNRAEFLIAYFAILANRAVVVNLSPGVASHDAAHVLSDSGAVVVIAEPEMADVLEAAAPLGALREVVRVEGPEPDGLLTDAGERVVLEAVHADPAEITDIGYTSGTTGLPKALPSDHAGLLRYADILLRCNPLDPGDRFLVPLQFHYGDPLWLLMISLELGTPLIVTRKFSVSRFWRTAHDFEATRIFTIGSIPNLLLTPEPSPADRDHSVRTAFSVAVPKAQHGELEERFGFPWLELYGSSESGAAIGMPAAMADRYVGTGALGVPFPEMDARLVDPDGTPIEAAAGQGELELSGAVCFHGYLGNPAATAEASHDGWLRSGDLMRRDADGVYYFEGRRKELIRRGGENIAPAEVEAVLRLHEAVIDAAVVPVPDPLRGEEVKAYVQVAAEEVEPRALIDFCGARLAAFKVPRYIEIRREAFPRTPSQRIPKAALMVDGAHQTATAWDREA